MLRGGWANILVRPQKRKLGPWRCSVCTRDFKQIHFAANHLRQSPLCRKDYGMIYFLSDQSEPQILPENSDARVPLEKQYDFVQKAAAVKDADDGTESDEGVDDPPVAEKKRSFPSTLGKRNWASGLICRVYDWCVREVKVDEKLGRRELCRMAAQRFGIPSATIDRWFYK